MLSVSQCFEFCLVGGICGSLLRFAWCLVALLAQPATAMPDTEASAFLFVTSCLSNQFGLAVNAAPLQWINPVLATSLRQGLPVS